MANTSKRGFASMDPSKQREIASKGGRAAHAKGTAHEFTSEEARVAGRKGGEAVSRDRAHMSQIGREGGHSRGARARAGMGGNGISGNDVSGDQALRGNTGSQPFVSQANEERGAFDSGRNQPVNRSSSGSQFQDREVERGSYASDRDRRDEI